MDTLNFSDVTGNDAALLACARAVALGRPLVLLGPPGTGKTMIARRVPLIMDPLTENEHRWLTAEYTGCEMLPRGGITSRPFRAPHHTVSQAALAGGPIVSRVPYHPGTPNPACRACVKAKRDHAHPWHTIPPRVVPHASELQLARFGVLMLDDLGEFPKAAVGHLAYEMRRMHGAPLIIATSTPCPCGWLGQTVRQCTCTTESISRHQWWVFEAMRVLGIADTVHVSPVDIATLRAAAPGDLTTNNLRLEVEAIRAK